MLSPSDSHQEKRAGQSTNPLCAISCKRPAGLSFSCPVAEIFVGSTWIVKVELTVPEVAFSVAGLNAQVIPAGSPPHANCQTRCLQFCSGCRLLPRQ